MDRRNFLKYSAAIGAGSMLLGNPLKLFAGNPEAVFVTGGEPTELIAAAMQSFGGMSTFISKGDIVVVKPNIGWDRAPEYAANTNPTLVSEIVKMCFEAGAKQVKVFDRTCNNPNRCYRNSKIEAYAEKVGADVVHIRDFKFKKLPLPEGEVLKEWPVYKDYLEADKVINVPVAKHHSMARVSLGLKNLMGVMGGNRGSLHNHFTEKITDINSHILPTLTIIDAYRILTANGPSGGNINDVKLTKSLVMSPCTVSADFLALELFNLKIENVSHINESNRRGLNKYDLNNLDVRRINLS
jgi:uncharacterized protein (DUF362 family)